MTAVQDQDREPDLSGQVLDRYRLLRCLGMGGMGAVYEAEHTALGKRVAVKVLRQQFCRHEISRKRFLREARAATCVAHPHVVEISDFGETPDGRVYFVMELLSGRELGELLEAEGTLPWPRVRDLMLQITSALAAAHEQGVVHRDMKPSNCFLVDVPGLAGRDFIKVLDFGIAKLTGKHGDEAQALTSTDEVFGTVGYMAPEMAMGVGDDPRSDVYAVGVMMYRMLVGVLPFEGGTAFQILARHVSEMPVPPRARQPSIPEGVERIILHAMGKLPTDRFQSMQALAEALQRGDLGPTTESTIRMSSGASHEQLVVERTVSLLDERIPTGPWGSVGSPGSTGGTEVITGNPALLSQRLAQLSESVRVSTMPEMPPVEAQRELTEDELALDSELVDPERGHRGWLLLGGIALGMVMTLGGVAWALLAGDESSEGSAAVEIRRDRAKPAKVSRHPTTEEDVVEPLPTRPSPQQEEPQTTDPEEPQELPTPPEPASERRRAPAEPVEAPKAPRATRKRAPKTDESVAASLEKKLRKRCHADGGTRVHIEGMIGTGGRVLSPLVTPARGPGACAKKVVKAASFAPRDVMRAMPELWVDL